MAIDEVLISALPGDCRAAALDHGTLVRLAFAGMGEVLAGEVRAGDLFLGRVAKVAPGLGAAFVEVGLDHPGLLMNADLPAERPRPAEGEAVLVQVVREPVGEKGAKLTARLPALDPRLAEAARHGSPRRLLTAADPVEALVRRAAGEGARRIAVDDPDTLTRLRRSVIEAAEAIEPWSSAQAIFHAEGVEDAIDAALAPLVALPGGGSLIIEETAAAVVIDVNSGATSGASARSATLTCDLEAAAMIGRLIVLRELAGLIVIDFAPLRRPSERARVVAALQAALSSDDRQLRIAGWTRLGLFEMVRERRGPTLLQRLGIRCPDCDGRGQRRSPRWAAGDALRELLAASRWTPGLLPNLVASPAVAAALRGPLAAARAAVEQTLGGAIAVIEEPTLAVDGFRLGEPARGGQIR